MILLSEKAVIVRFCLIAAVFKVQNSFASFDMILQKVFIDNFSAFVANDWITKLELHLQHSQWILLKILIDKVIFTLGSKTTYLCVQWSFDVQVRGRQQRKGCWASWSNWFNRWKWNFHVIFIFRLLTRCRFKIGAHSIANLSSIKILDNVEIRVLKRTKWAVS